MVSGVNSRVSIPCWLALFVCYSCTSSLMSFKNAWYPKGPQDALTTPYYPTSPDQTGMELCVDDQNLIMVVAK